MKRISHLAVAPLLALALSTPSAPAQAQMYSKHPVASSVLITSVASLAVVTAPIWLTSAGLGKLHDGSARRSRVAHAARTKAGPLPPLTVERVEQQADGGYQVALQNPQAPDDLAVLQWPARPDNAVAEMKVGDVLAFNPTPAGAGWTVAAADGTALAFLPTADAASSNLSERF